MILIFLSLQVVTNLLPFVFQEILYMISGWQSISTASSPFSRFQMQIELSWLAESSMLAAVGCHTTWPTLRWWCSRVRHGLVRFSVKPPSGISQILIVVSSEPDAIMLSSKGFQAISSTAPEWPPTIGLFGGRRPTCVYNNTEIQDESRFLGMYLPSPRSSLGFYWVGWGLTLREEWVDMSPVTSDHYCFKRRNQNFQ